MGVSTFTAAVLRRWRCRRLPLPAPNSAALIITGCDAGIGLGVALHAAIKLGLRVIGLVRDPSSTGAKYLIQASPNVKLVKCNLLEQAEIQSASTEAMHLLDAWNCRLLALVNNAGVMTMGKIEWQTPNQIHEQVVVNFISPVLLTKTIVPRLRRDTGRVVNVTSHCGLQALPYLSVYSATKSALEAWSEAILIEGIPVVTIRPGSYVAQSRILAGLPAYREEMWKEMAEESRQFHGTAFKKFYEYMAQIPVTDLGLVQDPTLMRIFETAFFARSPKLCYTNSPWRYFMYNFLFSVSPTYRIKHFFVKKFVSFPE